MKHFEYFENLIKDEFYKKSDKIYFKNKIVDKSKVIPNKPKNEDTEDITFPKYDKKEFPDNQFFKILFRNAYQDKTLIESFFIQIKQLKKYCLQREQK